MSAVRTPALVDWFRVSSWRPLVFGTVSLALLVSCSTDPASTAPEASPQPSKTPSETPSETPGDTPSQSSSQSPSQSPRTTPRLDSVAVLGHSGATGTQSDPDNPFRDATENSWATGENPQVRSIYLRLLEDHPAMKGHNYNLAINGSDVESLDGQIDLLMNVAEVLPDLVLIQSVDNDMRCDGTDAANVRPYGRTLDRALTRMEELIPEVTFFFTSQWATVDRWVAWASGLEGQVRANSGSGPCDVFDRRGRPRPAGMRSIQRIIDGYWGQVEAVCAEHRCFTDEGAEGTFVPTDADVTSDLNHLSIAGHAKYAAIAWRALPDAIKERR